jgi:hypothetical protein
MDGRLALSVRVGMIILSELAFLDRQDVGLTEI